MKIVMFVLILMLVIMVIALWAALSRNEWKSQAEYRLKIILDLEKQLRDNGIEPESKTRQYE